MDNCGATYKGFGLLGFLLINI